MQVEFKDGCYMNTCNKAQRVLRSMHTCGFAADVISLQIAFSFKYVQRFLHV